MTLVKFQNFLQVPESVPLPSLRLSISYILSRFVSSLADFRSCGATCGATFARLLRKSP